MKTLITGGAGYVGSHVCVELIQSGHQVTVIDNLSNSKETVIDQIETICATRPRFIKCDIRDSQHLCQIFNSNHFDAVIHFAGLKAVGESNSKPLEYYDVNVGGTISLLTAMSQANVKKIIFSSSATVYGDPASLPIHEDFPRSATNPYARTKLIIEDILSDLHRADPSFGIVRLRYFNPVGAHECGLIGENPNGTPNNLMPYIAQVASGKLPHLSVFGNDYPTTDGTGVRDYIHVMDLAEGHMAALEFIAHNKGLFSVNLGTGRGYSVLEMIQAFSKACGQDIPFVVSERRKGDVASCWADPNLAQTLLGWCAKRDLKAMCEDAWRWQQRVSATEAVIPYDRIFPEK